MLKIFLTTWFILFSTLLHSFAPMGLLQIIFCKIHGILVPKLTLGQFLTLSVRNGPNLKSYLFQEYISLNPRRVEQNYTKYL